MQNCINILTKGNGIGLIGGITLKNREDCDKYINFVINEHKKINPNLKEIIYVKIKCFSLFKIANFFYK